MSVENSKCISNIPKPVLVAVGLQLAALSMIVENSKCISNIPKPVIISRCWKAPILMRVFLISYQK